MILHFSYYTEMSVTFAMINVPLNKQTIILEYLLDKR